MTKSQQTSRKRKLAKAGLASQGFDSKDAKASKTESSTSASKATPNTAVSRVKSGQFCIRSSRNVPFLVVSNQNLVEGLPTPTSAEYQEMLSLCRDILKLWDRGSVVLADFEGEMTGLEGELLSAAFQRTLVLDAKSLRPQSCAAASSEMGLLFDLRCSEGVELTKRLMESDSVCKMIWGAAGDITSLRFTPVRKPLSITSASVVDAQLAYSSVGRRLAMEKMLERVPPKNIASLPAKGSIDFLSAHAFHRRALALPLQRDSAVYAVDDLHRLEAVLLSQKPSAGSYLAAQSQTSSLHSRLLNSPATAAQESLAGQAAAFEKLTGLDKQLAAVRAKRRILAMRALGFSVDESSTEKLADAILKEAKVVIPKDLEFGKAKAKEAPDDATASKVNDGNGADASDGVDDGDDGDGDGDGGGDGGDGDAVDKGDGGSSAKKKIKKKHTGLKKRKAVKAPSNAGGGVSVHSGASVAGGSGTVPTDISKAGLRMKRKKAKANQKALPDAKD
eukprot:TRINITY_DN6206_c0_g5_i1.p1 TRINITY_DN6206_c0_g5~~TRINITY_DN6206_c0_g5_i1.p1  ORF type:complete len:505 (-),score=125.97 TRINITY_DN6206_c0_g5_i1:123-1637(-)